MMKKNKGYSMIVLVIAITVIIILASSAVSMLQVSREKTAITNFIFDITTVEEEIQDFYITSGTLPIMTKDELDDVTLPLNADGTVNMNLLNGTSEGILSQLYTYDNENYYPVDLSKLGTITVKDSERKYIVNEGSLKVYVAEGVEYSNNDKQSEKVTYYTLNSDLVNGREPYYSQDEEILILGNPITWTDKADLRVVIPKKNLEAVGADSWSDWVFKWDFGPKTAEELAAIPDDEDNPRNFEYGDILTVKSNGVYSIYVKDPQNNVTVQNVNITKIDDISPKYKFIVDGTNANFQALDNETGIKLINFKTLTKYNENKALAATLPEEEVEGRTNLDYYLLDGQGKDMITTLQAEITAYLAERNTITKAQDDEENRFNKWKVETDMSLLTQEEIDNANSEHEDYMLDLSNQLTALYTKYPYLYDVYGKTEASRLVVYIEDYAGNATVVGDMDLISTKILADSYNISIEGLVKI